MINYPVLQIQVVVIQFDAAQREDTVILLAQVVSSLARFVNYAPRTAAILVNRAAV